MEHLADISEPQVLPQMRKNQ